MTVALPTEQRQGIVPALSLRKSRNNASFPLVTRSDQGSSDHFVLFLVVVLWLVAFRKPEIRFCLTSFFSFTPDFLALFPTPSSSRVSRRNGICFRARLVILPDHPGKHAQFIHAMHLLYYQPIYHQESNVLSALSSSFLRIGLEGANILIQIGCIYQAQ